MTPEIHSNTVAKIYEEIKFFKHNFLAWISGIFLFVERNLLCRLSILRAHNVVDEAKLWLSGQGNRVNIFVDNILISTYSGRVENVLIIM